MLSRAVPDALHRLKTDPPNETTSSHNHTIFNFDR